MQLATKPAGAKVTVDGEAQSSPTNCEVTLKPGEHTLVFEKDGYKSTEAKLSIPEGTEPFVPDAFTLVSNVHRKITFKTEPAGATILVDGKPLVAHTPAAVDLPLGSHKISARLSGYGEFHQTIEVTGKSSSDAGVFPLKRLPPITVAVSSLPPGAALSIDDQDMAKVTNTSLRLWPGFHRLGLTLAGHKPIHDKIEVPATGPFIIRTYELVKQAPARKTMTNSLEMTLVYLGPGEFEMGAPDSDPDAVDNEKPIHKVEIKTGFYLAETEVTFHQWQKFVQDAKYTTAAEKNDGETLAAGFNADTRTFTTDAKFNWRNTGWLQSPEHPVVNVTCQDAEAFCKWLSEKEGKKYRLPTEAEWEYGCRAGTTTRFWNGDVGVELAKIDNIADESLSAIVKKTDAIPQSDSQPYTSPVRAYGEGSRNPWGLFGMHGNVSEWCDVHAPASDTPTPADSDPSECWRGGSWYWGPAAARSSAREIKIPGSCFNYVGFRVVCEGIPKD